MNAQAAQEWQQAWGSDREFAQLYDHFLDAVYAPTLHQPPSAGRRELTMSIVRELRLRRVGSVLDCAAGTGFPALDLAQKLPDFVVHCTDASVDMLNILVARAGQMGVGVRRLTPPHSVVDLEQAEHGLMLDWKDLAHISRSYDYVMCRGNSLAYANSWGGHRQTVASLQVIREDLEQMAARVRPGGYLHVDAPWRLDLPSSVYRPVAGGALSIEEEVVTRPDHRYWRVEMALPTGQTLKFEQYSTRLTIYDVQAMLDDMNFDRTTPFRLAGERSGFGVIIARKPE